MNRIRIRVLFEWVDDHIAMLGLIFTAAAMAFAINVVSQRSHDNKTAIQRAQTQAAQYEYIDCLGRAKSRDGLRSVVMQLTSIPFGEERQAAWRTILESLPPIVCPVPQLSGVILPTTTAPATPSTTGAP